jgi:chromate reductase
LDWASTNTLGNLLTDKPVAITGASRTYYGTARGQLHLRQVLLAANADVLRKPEVYIRRTQNLVDENGHITDKRTLDKIQSLVDAFLNHITYVK